jgi:hypothetical protein
MRQLIQRHRRRERGSSLVEFSIVFLLFVGLTFAILDFGHLFFVRLTLHNAVREASRFTLTGGTLPDPNNPGQFLSRVDSIVLRMQQVAPSLTVDPGDVTIIGPGGPGDPGGPEDPVTIRIDYDIPLLTPFVRELFPDGVDHYSVSILSQNEPFAQP